MARFRVLWAVAASMLPIASADLLSNLMGGASTATDLLSLGTGGTINSVANGVAGAGGDLTKAADKLNTAVDTLGAAQAVLSDPFSLINENTVAAGLQMVSSLPYQQYPSLWATG